MDGVEHEICANCKKEIPNHNYVMHMAHCARNITLCQICKEPIQKSLFEEHKKKCVNIKKPMKKSSPPPPPTVLEKSEYYQERKAIEDRKVQARKERQFAKLDKLVDSGDTMKSSIHQQQQQKEVMTKQSEEHHHQPKKSNNLLACKFCDLELPKLDLEEHENYCGSRTDKCLQCGELVMFKYKQIHMDSNHGFLKLNDEPGPRPSWDSTTQREPSARYNRRPPPLRPFSGGYDSTLYSFPSTFASPSSSTTQQQQKDKEKSESYKEISRRLDCKTEYIRNLLHDSASITVPLRHNGAVPRNHFNHNKGPAPQPPPHRRRNPPTELVIPCEFCSTPIPHEDLIQHETGCRPDLARFNPSSSSSSLNRRRSPKYYDEDDDDDYSFTGINNNTAATSNSPDIELPCEFCSDMIPASQLLRHQATCN